MTKVNRRNFVLGSGAILSVGLTTNAHANDATGAWTPLRDMPFPVQEIYPAAFRKSSDPGPSLKPKPLDILVNAGGMTPDDEYFNVTDAVTFYDPAYDAWGYGTPLPEPRHHLSLVNNNGLLYAIGGFARNDRGGWQMRSDCWRLRELNGRWERMRSLPHPQAESVCLSLNRYIHVVGGRAPAGSSNAQWSDHIDTDEHWYFDAGENRWHSLAPLPRPRNSSAGAVVNGVLYVIGGRTVSDGNMTAVDVYDPLADRWEAAKPMPKAQAGLAASVLNGKIYVFGGEYFKPGNGGVFAEAWEYDPDKDDWRAVAAMPRPRHGLGAVTLGNAIYVLGGASQPSGVGTSAALDRFEI
ncbi:Kelch repeat-containing protein [Hyphococcus sp. DH-69]|uniref:Kelch repeat-containing protein n=1 Tax=Hyphococcus formosus TaxID=3143534 RepID=UPI00398A7979